MCWLVVYSGRLVCILGPAQPDYNLPFAFSVYIPLKLWTEAAWCHSPALCVGLSSECFVLSALLGITISNIEQQSSWLICTLKNKCGDILYVLIFKKSHENVKIIKFN